MFWWVWKIGFFFICRKTVEPFIKQVFILLFQRLQGSKTTKYVKGLEVLAILYQQGVMSYHFDSQRCRSRRLLQLVFNRSRSWESRLNSWRRPRQVRSTFCLFSVALFSIVKCDFQDFRNDFGEVVRGRHSEGVWFYWEEDLCSWNRQASHANTYHADQVLAFVVGGLSFYLHRMYPQNFSFYCVCFYVNLGLLSCKLSSDFSNFPKMTRFRTTNTSLTSKITQVKVCSNVTWRQRQHATRYVIVLVL